MWRRASSLPVGDVGKLEARRHTQSSVTIDGMASRSIPPQMKQALIVGPTRFDVTTARVPELREPGEILLRTAACGICSGDLMPWYLAKKVGSVLGHEVVGWAVEVGRDVSHIRVGDLVFAHHHAPCLQ